MNVPDIAKEIDENWKHACICMGGNDHREALFYLGRIKSVVDILAGDILREMDKEKKNEPEHKVSVI